MPSVPFWLIPAAPLAASVLIALFGSWLGEKSHRLCWLALVISTVCGLRVLTFQPEGEVGVLYQWIDITGFQIPIVYRADALTALMLAMVSFVSLLVAIFSAGYMHGDPGYPRFFAVFSLFVFSMTSLVLAGNFLLLYVFWEGVGLCSYLLIGFWFQRPSAAAAARKAFLVNRIGDFGFLLGIFLIWWTFGSLDYQATLGAPDVIDHLAKEYPGRFTTICLLLLVGAIGKSAQFPLHVWLPDAMEGPTPASALIHAATMVTAGVYMIGRCTPFYVHAPAAQAVVASIGGITALLAALIALTQHDLKRVLAYSTVSQLGYMFLALGSAAASPELATVAVTAAIFHLFTHAFFKALLFLSAGSVMHAMGDVIDMRRFSGLRKALPITHAAFLCGALALAGLPPFSGFWSKDEILASLYLGSETGSYRALMFLLFLLSVATAGLTAFYTFRAYLLTFWGPEKFPREAGHHPHDAGIVMAIPLAVLSLFALGIGFAVGWTHLFAHYLEHATGLSNEEHHHVSQVPMILGSIAAFGGVLVALAMYRGAREAPARLAERFPVLHDLSLHRFYLDEIYDALVVGPLTRLARRLVTFDVRALDATVDAIGHLPAAFGRIFRIVQNGMVQSYAILTFMGLAVFLFLLVFGRGQ